MRDREALDAAATVDRYVQHLGQRDFKAYFDEPMEALAIVLSPHEAASMAQLATFTITKAGWLTNVADNVFAALLRDNPKLVWTVKSDDENLTCMYPFSYSNFKCSVMSTKRLLCGHVSPGEFPSRKSNTDFAMFVQGSLIKLKAVFRVRGKYSFGQVCYFPSPVFPDPWCSKSNDKIREFLVPVTVSRHMSRFRDKSAKTDIRH